MKNALLFTNNATIKKLFSLSLEKKGMELIEGDIQNPNFAADIIFIDNEILNNELLDKLKNTNVKKVLILGKNEEKKDGFNEYMNKPFLPTDLIELLTKLENSDEDDLEKDLKDFDDFEISHDLDDDFEENTSIDDDLNLSDIDTDDDLSFEDLDFEDSSDLETIDLNKEKEHSNLVEELDELNDNEDFEEINLDEQSTKKDILSSDDNIDEDDISVSEEDLSSQTNIDSFDDISINDDELGIKEEDNMDLDEFEKEIENIDEASIADAIGENLDDLNTKNLTSNEENLETQDINTQNINTNIQTDEEKKATVASLLNLDLESLKNSGAKITITIEFDKE